MNVYVLTSVVWVAGWPGCRSIDDVIFVNERNAGKPISNGGDGRKRESVIESRRQEGEKVNAVWHADQYRQRAHTLTLRGVAHFRGVCVNKLLVKRKP